VPNTNSSHALTRLRALLAADPLNSDGRLPTERELAERLGVGRRAVRRALDVLEAEGRIWRRQGKGTFVDPQPARTARLTEGLAVRSNPVDVMEARLEMEPALARLSALRARPDEVRRMRQLVDKISTAPDADARELWDSALHRLIAVTAGNPILLTVFDIVDQVRQDDVWHHLRQRARSDERARLYARQHASIVDAIEARDAPGALAAMRAHIRAVQESLLAVTPAEIAG
jgi:GntR family transcriptional regulator, transcriptional repressor for pyruvate dehydrogenase complex